MIPGAAEIRRGETLPDPVHHLIRWRYRSADRLKMTVDPVPRFVNPNLVNQDLDPRLVLVIAAAETVIDMKDGIDIGQQVLLGQEFRQHPADAWRPPKAAANPRSCIPFPQPR